MIKNKDLPGLTEALEEIKDRTTDIDVLLFCADNQALAKQEMRVHESLVLPSRRFKEYDNKRREISIKYSKKDPKTKRPLTVKDKNGILNYDIYSKNRIKFNTEIGELKEEYNDVFIESENKKLLFEEITKRKCRIKFKKIRAKKLPNNLSKKTLMAIKPLLTIF